jgi:hypothetical protein
MLEGIDQLTTMRGTPGLLNRAVTDGHWISDDISRDQYLGIFFGLSLTHELVEDLEVREACRKNIEAMLDYLLDRRWVVLKNDGTIAVVWHGYFIHQLAWLRAGMQVHPEKYAAAFEGYAPLVDLAWFVPWITTLDPVGMYFKFNLEHGAFFTYLRLESDPDRWMKAYKGFRILRRALEHHLQAHFNVMAVAITPALAASIGPETRGLLRLWLKRPRRYVDSTVTDVETALYTPPGSSESWVISKFPLSPDRRPSADFLWQRNPFDLQSWGDGTVEGPGIDYGLPYWMGRYYGLFPNP